jgi:nitrate/nitrite-specific signal transduction histidine kinase
VAKAARENLDLGPAIVFPLGAAGSARGVLTIGRHPGAMPLPRAAADLLTTFAAQAAIALELAERRSDAERLAVFEDRDRIARDLHDLVIQRLCQRDEVAGLYPDDRSRAGSGAGEQRGR